MAIASKINGEWLIGESIAIDRYSVEGTIEEVKANLDRIRLNAVAMGMWGEGYLDISLTDTFYGDVELDIAYRFNRTENEEERARRAEVERREREAAKAKRKAAAERKKIKTDPEYAEFLRLKEKFGEVK